MRRFFHVYIFVGPLYPFTEHLSIPSSATRLKATYCWNPPPPFPFRNGIMSSKNCNIELKCNSRHQTLVPIDVGLMASALWLRRTGTPS